MPWVDLLSSLAVIERRQGYYRTSVWRCRCNVGDCDRVPTGAALPGGDWSRCPYGLLRDRRFSAVTSFVRAARVSPLAGWPDAFPAWLAFGIMERSASTGA